MHPEMTWARGAVSRISRGARVLRRARRGSTALEFAIAAPVLLMLIFAVIENGLMLFAQAVLENATRDASRQIMIGTVKTSPDFRAALCDDMGALFDCTQLQFYVQSGPAFPLAITAPDSSGKFSSTTFASGSGGQFVLVEVAYNRAYISPWLISLVPNWVLFSTQAIKNEPFS